MALNKEGKLQNVKASIEKYIYDNLVLVEGLEIAWEGKPFEEGNALEWVQESIVGVGERMYHRQVNGSDVYGNTTMVMLSFNIFVNPEKTHKTNRNYEIRDIIHNYFTIGKSISLYDFSDDDFTTSLQEMQVDEIMTDGQIPNEEYQQYNITYVVEWLEKWDG